MKRLLILILAFATLAFAGLGQDMRSCEQLASTKNHGEMGCCAAGKHQAPVSRTADCSAQCCAVVFTPSLPAVAIEAPVAVTLRWPHPPAEGPHRRDQPPAPPPRVA